MIGDWGDDELNGGSGADALRGGGGVDLIRYDGSATGIAIDLAFSNAYFGDAAGDTFESIENVGGTNFNDGVWGSDDANTIFTWLGDDYLDGRGGIDVLLAGGGADTIVGGGGADYLAGEGGADIFSFLSFADSATNAMDFLADFSSAQGDKISVAALTGGTGTFNSGWGTGYSVYAYDQGGWALVQVYQGADLQMQMVVNQASLSATDFLL